MSAWNLRGRTLRATTSASRSSANVSISGSFSTRVVCKKRYGVQCLLPTATVIVVSHLPDGVSETRICGEDRIVGERATVHDRLVAVQKTHNNHAPASIDGERLTETSVLLSAADFDALLGELAALRKASAGTAGPGSVVTVSDRAARTWEYELVEHDEPRIERQKVTLSSPVGKALLGARPGDHVPLTLGNGRRRRVRVLDVS